MTNAKTSWEDLAHLGWSKDKIFERLNGWSDNFMKDESQMHLGDTWAATHNCPCDNTLINQPELVGAEGPLIERTKEVVWTYNNPELKPHSGEHEEKWSDKATVDLTIAKPASIQLGDEEITIKNAAHTGLDVSIPINATQPVHKEASHNHEIQWTFEVPPLGSANIVRTKTIAGRIVTYRQVYGISNIGRIGAEVEHNGQSGDVAYGVNHFLDNPRGAIEIIGSGTTTIYEYQLVISEPHHWPTVRVLETPTSLVKSNDATADAGEPRFTFVGQSKA